MFPILLYVILSKLPQDVVDVPSINTFKNTLDRHKHDMMTLS